MPQLAYYDPVKLTMQTNIDYDYIVDCVSQALLFVYVGKDSLEKLTRQGIRGAYEMHRGYALVLKLFRFGQIDSR